MRCAGAGFGIPGNGVTVAGAGGGGLVIAFWLMSLDVRVVEEDCLCVWCSLVR